MKTSKKTGKAPESKLKKTSDSAKGRKMEPLKSKELKNKKFDDFDDDDEDKDIDPEDMAVGNLESFDDFFDDDDED